MSKKVKAAMPDLKRMYACCIKRKVVFGNHFVILGNVMPKNYPQH